MNAPLLLLNDDLPRPVCIDAVQGQVAVFSQRAPGSTDPNEDSALVYPTEDGLVLAVADGAGGCAEGEKASRLAIESLAKHLHPQGGDLRGPILDGFDLANHSILGLGSGAATTLSVIHVGGSAGAVELRPFHAGDSSVLVTGGRGKVKLNTIPHSPVGYAVEAGLLDQDEALHHSDLNLVSNMVGQSDMRIEMGSLLTLATRDTVVIGTDGLFDNLHIWEIVQMARRGPLDEAAMNLVRLAHSRMNAAGGDAPSKPDDLTFAVFRPRKAQQGRQARPVRKATTVRPLMAERLTA